MDRLFVLGLLAILAVFCTEAATPALSRNNTASKACFLGSGITTEISIDCYVPNEPFQVVVVHRVFHGLTPTSSGCPRKADKEACCPAYVDPAQECVFASEDEAVKVRNTCDGILECSTNLERASVGEACPNRTYRGVELSYESYSYFAYVEYSCLEIGQMTDVCKTNVVKTADVLFLEANFILDQNYHTNATCSCVVVTDCGHALLFEMLEVDLNQDTANGTCTENVVLTEGDSSGTILANLTCGSESVAALYRQEAPGGVLESLSSVVSLDLLLTSVHVSRLLIRVTATGGVPVEVVCGQPGIQAVLMNQTNCSSSSSSSSTTPSTETQDLSSPTINTTEVACLKGEGSTIFNYNFQIDCQNVDVSTSGLISVERVFHGVTPKVLGCNSSAPKESCCPGFNPARDCVFPTEERLSQLREKCDGSLVCSYKLESVAVPSGACPAREAADNVNLTYDDYSTFAFVEYSCLNVGLMSDVCDAGNTIRNKEVYLDNNVYHANQQQGQTTCSCVISTVCEERLLFSPLILDLATNGSDDSVCLEWVTIVDAGNDSVRVNLSCSDNELDEVPANNRSPVFQSDTNVVHFQLHLQSDNLGKMLFKVVATDDAIVEARCGRTTELPVWKEHQCATADPGYATTLTLPTTAAAGATTTTSSRAVTSDVDETSDTETIIAVAAGVVAFIILIAFIVFIVIMCRSKKCRNSEDGAVVIYDNNWERMNGENNLASTSAYNTVVLPLPARGTDSEKHDYETVANGSTPEDPHVYSTVMDSGEVEGATGGVVDPVNLNSISYDVQNVLNNARMSIKEKAES